MLSTSLLQLNQSIVNKTVKFISNVFEKAQTKCLEIFMATKILTLFDKKQKN